MNGCGGFQQFLHSWMKNHFEDNISNQRAMLFLSQFPASFIEIDHCQHCYSLLKNNDFIEILHGNKGFSLFPRDRFLNHSQVLKHLSRIFYLTVMDFSNRLISFKNIPCQIRFSCYKKKHNYFYNWRLDWEHFFPTLESIEFFCFVLFVSL